MLTFHVAAEVSKGGHVLISNHEDRVREVSRPRIAAAGADMDRVHTFDPKLAPLPEGFDQLREEVKHFDARLVVLDPFSSHLSVPAGNPYLVRRALDPIEGLCEETGCAVLIVPHQVKYASPNADPLMTIGGPAAGLVAMCRAVYLCGTSPEDSDELVLATAKYNLGAKPPSVCFELDVDEDGNAGAAFLHYRGESSVTAHGLVASQYREAGEPKQSKSERAAEWLARYLCAAGEPCEPKQVAQDAARQKPPITARQLRRAAAELGATEKDGGRGAKWDLPDDLRELLDSQYEDHDE